MISKFIFFILLLTGCCKGFSQTRPAIDSLYRQLTIAKDDTSRINAMIGLCIQYRLGNSDSAIFYGEQAFQLSQKINYPTGEILALSFMGLTIVQLGDLPKALEMGFKALQTAKSNNLENITSPTLNHLGEVYLILKDYPKALYYFEKQKNLYETIEINEGFGYALYDLGNVYEEMNQLDSARHYELQAYEFFRKSDREEPLVFKTLGNIEMKSGKPVKALSYYKQSLQIAIQNNERRATCYAYNKLAEFFKKINQPDSAIYYAQKGLDESTAIAQKKSLQEAAALLSGLYEQKDAKESLRYLKIADAYKDSLFGAGNLQAIQVIINQQAEHQKEIEDSRTRYQNNLKLYALFAGLGILLLVAVILYRNNRQKQKANKILEATLGNLKSAQSQLIQSEKMASLGELTAGIAHEIQNPLNFVNNFSEVSNELIDEIMEEVSKGNYEEVKALAGDVKQNLEKINHHGKRADGIVKGMLQHSRSSSGQKEPTNINALADEYLRLAYHGLRAKDKSFNATLKTDYDENTGSISIIPQDIGRVILNLINNAFMQ
ncbi:MAG: tetratricopeptide repeat protein [Bacteroidota bacterium]